MSAGRETVMLRSLARGAALGEARRLLEECLARVTDKPWDDPSLLHARVSEFLGLPVSYPDLVARQREEDAR